MKRRKTKPQSVRPCPRPRRGLLVGDDCKDEFEAPARYHTRSGCLAPYHIVVVVSAKAETHIPEPVVMGPRHKRVYARFRRAMRGDDS
jgi:hypothetical protein